MNIQEIEKAVDTRIDHRVGEFERFVGVLSERMTSQNKMTYELLSSEIKDVKKDLKKLEEKVDSIQEMVAKNTEDISSLTTMVTQNTNDISSLTTMVGENTKDISEIKSSLKVR